MPTLRPRVLLALLAALSAPLGSAPNASASRAEMLVGATVLARAFIADEANPPVLEVTPADVARGYVELKRATRLTIANTSPYGYALDVWPTAPVFREVRIEGLGAQVRLGDEGGEIVTRNVRGPALPLVLDYRFALAPGLQPGLYPWPLRFQVRPLTGI